MRVVIDIEANALKSPTKIWVVVARDLDTGTTHIFRRVSDDVQEKQRLLDLLSAATLFIGHNWLEYDYPVLNNLLGYCHSNIALASLDTLILSRLVDYSRQGGHSIEAYGEEFGIPKGQFSDWSKYSQEMEDYCVRDVDICHNIYLKYHSIISDSVWSAAISLEHSFQLLVNQLQDNGFCFNVHRARSLLDTVSKELDKLDEQILSAFPPREVLIREFTPRSTKFGTISRTSVPRSLWDNISDYSIGNTYRHTHMVPFNPSSHKQLIEVLWEAGWKPEDKTQTHIDFIRSKVDNADILRRHVKYGWRINENNLSTLPHNSPAGARLLAKRILLESRRRTLTEWLSLASVDTGRIHGKFLGIGAWTHRMAHQRPNTANIPTAVEMDGSPKLLGKEMRSLWCAPKNRLLVGVDAEGIQLRIFAHYINDPEFTDALVRGNKGKRTDPHSLNQRILGDVCKSRQAAKRFIYALLLGGGIGKLSTILGCSIPDTKKALDRLLLRYTGFAEMRSKVFPLDAKRGWFHGLDNRRVSIPDDTFSGRKHLAMSGYLQNGEAIVMKKAALLWHKNLSEVPDLGRWLFVNQVHDEWQTEVKNDFKVAKKIAEIQADSLRLVGEELKLRCPLAGSFYNEEHKDFTIGTNWYQTH